MTNYFWNKLDNWIYKCSKAQSPRLGWNEHKTFKLIKLFDAIWWHKFTGLWETVWGSLVRPYIELEWQWVLRTPKTGPVPGRHNIRSDCVRVPCDGIRAPRHPQGVARPAHCLSPQQARNEWNSTPIHKHCCLNVAAVSIRRPHSRNSLETWCCIDGCEENLPLNHRNWCITNYICWISCFLTFTANLILNIKHLGKAMTVQQK